MRPLISASAAIHKHKVQLIVKLLDQTHGANSRLALHLAHEGNQQQRKQHAQAVHALLTEHSEAKAKQGNKKGKSK